MCWVLAEARMDLEIVMTAEMELGVLVVCVSGDCSSVAIVRDKGMSVTFWKGWS